MSGETIIVEREAGVVTVTLNRPERKNAANGTMWQELYATVQEVTRRRDDRVLVITGAGGAFCSGADIGDPKGISGDSEDPPLTRMRFLGSVMLALYDLPKPTIAKIRGIAAGAGLSLALCCDLTVVSSTARLSEIFSKRDSPSMADRLGCCRGSSACTGPRSSSISPTPCRPRRPSPSDW